MVDDTSLSFCTPLQSERHFCPVSFDVKRQSIIIGQKILRQEAPALANGMRYAVVVYERCNQTVFFTRREVRRYKLSLRYLRRHNLVKAPQRRAIHATSSSEININPSFNRVRFNRALGGPDHLTPSDRFDVDSPAGVSTGLCPRPTRRRTQYV